ncbi:Glycerol kinase [Crateriforma conspicua]|uniref:Glycerol kinase n=1 Tax=Crateriforma conspicua TaxID=2527996 RepID=A0A5C6FUD8_9PLAN|nr:MULTISPECIES: glycerol kinase GlpK [Crateriforma]TWU65195.1 Glycerol kinase [Crateriforma conspicua]
MILALDQGTTSSRALLIHHDGSVVGMKQQEFTQHYPKPGWVEHDALQIWQTQRDVAQQLLQEQQVPADAVSGIGITNQRETTIIWNRDTGQPLAPAIVWQDRRTAEQCERLVEAGHSEQVRNKTGLVIDPYFCATKLRWLLDHTPDARRLADSGKVAFGTVDSWLIWNLTGGQRHITDVTNASRTMLWNLSDQRWDDELLKLFDIPASVLPDVVLSSAIHGETIADLFGSPIRIAGIAGDQQAALMGQNCSRHGMAKNTYGTGCFMLMNIGNHPMLSESKLLTTAACRLDESSSYALEGSIFVAGAAVQWLRDGLGIIEQSSDVEALAAQVDDTDDVYLVPALAGLGAPHWDAHARGTLIGITRGTTRAHLARATLEGIAFQVADVLDAMKKDSGIDPTELRVDGGAAANNLLMQFQADILGVPVVRPKSVETTAMGAAYLAGLATGFWKDTAEIETIWTVDQTFHPTMSSDEVIHRRGRWRDAVSRSRHWDKA